MSETILRLLTSIEDAIRFNKYEIVIGNKTYVVLNPKKIYEYDEVGNVKKVKLEGYDFNGKKIVVYKDYIYDDQGKLIEISEWKLEYYEAEQTRR